MAQQSANQETKSSSGDKYETGRAMAQLEIEKASGQLAEARKLLQVLERVHAGQASDTVRMGSIVFTSQGNYFIAIPAGKLVPEQVRDGADWFAISASSPLGAVLIGCKSGERVVFHGKEMLITQVA
jgi:transcription elongation GreA/GreB family factor